MTINLKVILTVSMETLGFLFTPPRFWKQESMIVSQTVRREIKIIRDDDNE